MQFAALIPILPAVSAAILMLGAGRLTERRCALLGVGSIVSSAVLVAGAWLAWADSPGDRTLQLWTWFRLDTFESEFAFRIDGLALVMMSVITGVGALIHLYSVEFMAGDSGFARYFGSMNLFVAAMLVLVMADNLLLLYLGWEGVGMCSYLLIGFWYRKAANGAAARKAFIVTRIGDVLFALGLFLLATELGTLNIDEVLERSEQLWSAGDSLPLLATLLLLGGAVGKSAQLPLHTWLPDAMAGPTPVSALIHAATMVTAGVYLVIRLHGLFELAPTTMAIIAWVGLATALLAAVTALSQNDIKRILAYSTLSQIGYMFLAVGVGAYAVALLHLVTHAFFKALLFLAAGAVTHCLHHEHNIFRMGGLARRLPLVFVAFLAGAAALAALPMTSGYHSKELILAAAWEDGGWSYLLWFGGITGAFLTSLYTFRLVFAAFFGVAQQEPDRSPGWRMALPLLLLTIAAIFGGALDLPVDGLVATTLPHAPLAVGVLGTLVPIAGAVIAFLRFAGGGLVLPLLLTREGYGALGDFFHEGWRIDTLYDRTLVRPFLILRDRLAHDPMDGLTRLTIAINGAAHRWLAVFHNGRIRSYLNALALGLVLLLAFALGKNA